MQYRRSRTWKGKRYHLHTGGNRFSYGETIRRRPICRTKPIAVVVYDVPKKGATRTTESRRYPIFVTENGGRYRIKWQ